MQTPLVRRLAFGNVFATVIATKNKRVGRFYDGVPQPEPQSRAVVGTADDDIPYSRRLRPKPETGYMSFPTRAQSTGRLCGGGWWGCCG